MDTHLTRPPAQIDALITQAVLRQHFMLNTVAWEQILPLLFVFLFAPLLALSTYKKRVHSPPWLAAMLFENLGLGFAWGWVNNHDTTSTSKDKKTVRKKHVRRAPAAKDHDSHEAEEYYPGLVNISGTYCFLNSTLQAMASLCYLQPHVEAIHSKAERYDVPTPVIDALRDTLIELNTSATSPRALRPVHIINALSTPAPGKSRSPLFSSREHQDAQELFQLLSESIKNEARAVDEEASRDPGLGALSRGLSAESDGPVEREMGKGVFDGLTANRRSCVECGYTEAVMHFSFDNWQLAVPRVASCRLEDCLADYTRLELLGDCICRKCSMLATHKRLVTEAKAFETADEGASTTKKKRAKEARKLEARVKAAIDEGRIEEDLKGVKMEKVVSRCSTKQAMIARPPSILALHLNRSIHYGHSGVKNTCRVAFPENLDLTPFTTSGQLSTSPSAPLSSTPITPARVRTPTPATFTPRVLYRLSAVVCHYGVHSFGHYVAYRRRPRPRSAGARRFVPPTLCCPIGCSCDACTAFGPIRDEDYATDGGKASAPRWLRISDDSVEEVGVDAVLAESAGTFMLYYERVAQPRPAIWPVQSEPCSSEETIKPVGTVQHEHVSPSLLEVPQTGARIVRSVYAGKSWSPSRNASPAASITSLSSLGEVVDEQESVAPSSTAHTNGDAVPSHIEVELSDKLPSTTPLPLPPHTHQYRHIVSPQPIHVHRTPSPTQAVGLHA